MSLSPTTLAERVRARGSQSRSTLDRVLGSPIAFIATACILLALFGWTFLANPDRVAPTKDPAYYTWRTEALITEEPQAFLDVTGPFDFFSSGYRVSAPILGGLLRHVPGFSELHMTSVLMVLIPVVTSLLLAGFAYRQRRDPLLWHSVAFLSASLYLTPPFVGYLDNILCLLFLAASLSFISDTRDSWPARIGFAGFLLAAGLTHPTTLVFFGFSLGLMTLARLVWRKFDLGSVISDDGPMLLSALAAAVVTYVIWSFGIWGLSLPLADAALAPPYDSDFFLSRMGLWVDALRPLVNGPLFAIALVGIFVAGRRWVEDDLSRVAVLWLAPLAGLFGFLGGLTYPYYRFFNTTLAWVLLVGLGGWFLIRLFSGWSAFLGIAGTVLIALIVATNFINGFDVSGWNDAEGGWINSQTQTDLAALRAELEAQGDSDRPVVFVIDQEDRSQQVYGYTKLSGNTSRFGLPDGMIDQGYLYLGDVENFLAGSATSSEGQPLEPISCEGDATKEAMLDGDVYNALSSETLCDFEDKAEGEPIVVVAAAFNSTGANAELAAGEGAPPEGAEVWAVSDGQVSVVSGGDLVGSPPEEESAGPAHILLVLGGSVLLLLGGALAFVYFLPDGGIAEALGMAPALSMMLLSLVGTALLAVTGSPFGTGAAWVTTGLIVALGAVFFVAGRAARRRLY